MMRVNQDLAICAPKVLLVPYDAHHVARYHEWMQDEALREATASDQLSLAEEYENQTSWRTAHDKLTFIVCLPAADGASRVYAGENDAPPRMVGDVNLFLTPDYDDGERGGWNDVQGEIDVMIAVPEHRRRGLGEAAVRVFLRFLAENVDAIMGEYARGASSTGTGSNAPAVTEASLKRLVAKIHAGNAGSIRLFENLGFRRDGEPNYFNEISLLLSDFPAALSGVGLGAGGSGEGGDGLYRECFYDRCRLGK